MGEWKTLDEYVRGLGRETAAARGDGHYLLHSICESLKADDIVEITHEALCVIILNEVNEYKQFYEESGQENINVLQEVQKYVTEMTYNSEAGDMKFIDTM